MIRLLMVGAALLGLTQQPGSEKAADDDQARIAGIVAAASRHCIKQTCHVAVNGRPISDRALRGLPPELKLIPATPAALAFEDGLTVAGRNGDLVLNVRSVRVRKSIAVVWIEVYASVADATSCEYHFVRKKNDWLSKGPPRCVVT